MRQPERRVELKEARNEDFRRPKRAMILSIIWREIPAPAGSQRAYMKGGTLFVVVTEERHDNEWWRHASCSREDRLPSWEDLREVKKLFIGRDSKAVQVLPAESEYVNLHPYVLHLWSNLDRDLLPDFRVCFDGVVGI